MRRNLMLFLVDQLFQEWLQVALSGDVVVVLNIKRLVQNGTIYTNFIPINPVLVHPEANPSKMAIGQECDATNHPGKESFHGEIARFLVYERPLSDALAIADDLATELYEFSIRNQIIDRLWATGKTAESIADDFLGSKIPFFGDSGRLEKRQYVY